MKKTYDYKLETGKKDGDKYKLSVKVIYNKETVDILTINVTVSTKENTSQN